MEVGALAVRAREGNLWSAWAAARRPRADTPRPMWNLAAAALCFAQAFMFPWLSFVEFKQGHVPLLIAGTPFAALGWWHARHGLRYIRARRAAPHP